MTEEAAAPAPEATPAPAPAAAPPAAPEAAPAPEGPAANDYFGRAMAAMVAQDEPPPAPAAAPADPDQGGPAPADAGETSEATPPEPPAPTEVDPNLLLGRERAAFEEEKQAFAARQAEIQPQLAALERVKTASGVDAVMAMQELGVEYQELTRRILQNPRAAAAPEADPEKAELRQQMVDLNARFDKAEAQVVEAKRETLTQQASSVIRKQVDESPDPARWELLKAEPDYGRQVVDYVEQHWIASGKPMGPTGQPQMTLTVDQAADNLEAYLLKQITRYGQSSKVRSHFTTPAEPSPEPPPVTPPTAPAATPGATPTPATVPTPATLTPSHASTAARSDDTSDPAACRARAIAVLEQQHTDQ